MKYTIEELSFAESVRALASGIRLASKPKPLDGAWEAAEFVQRLAQWEAANPLVLFVPEALGRIKEVADAIRVDLKEA